MPDLDQIKQGEQASARPARGRSLRPPIEESVRAGGFLAGRRGHHPGAEGGREALSRSRPRHLRQHPSAPR
jgi:hypothetical protein